MDVFVLYLSPQFYDVTYALRFVLYIAGTDLVGMVDRLTKEKQGMMLFLFSFTMCPGYNEYRNNWL